jgi:hypothetical protein
MKISATSFARHIFGTAEQSVKSLSYLKLKVIQDISYSISTFVEEFTYASGYIVPDLFAKRKFFASNVFGVFKGRGFLRNSVVYRVAAVLVVVYILATQLARAPP